MGGIAKVWLIPSSLISSLLYEGPLPTITLPQGWRESSWGFSPVFQSGQYAQDTKVSSSGTAWENTVTFKLPKLSTQARAFTALLSHARWAVLLLDENGQYLLMGSGDYPMRATSKSTTGQDMADLSHVAITVSGVAPRLPVFLSEPQ